jgi:hypothetical protein
MMRIAILAAILATAIPAARAAHAQPIATDGASRVCARHFRVAIVDEYGFRYDARGDRLNAQGCIIPPPHTPPGGHAIQD